MWDGRSKHWYGRSKLYGTVDRNITLLDGTVDRNALWWVDRKFGTVDRNISGNKVLMQFSALRFIVLSPS